MIRFEWDPAKATSNRRKHGVGFELALHVFDPNALVEHDRIESGERRWQTLGLVGGMLLLLVAHTVRFDDEDEAEEIIRIISAREADPKERQRYEKERQKSRGR
jgi:uncharacterized DUF497 family protein